MKDVALRRPTRNDLLAARNRPVPDVIAPGLKVLFCGINPGLYSGAVGHHFARPGNRFWMALFLGGFTDRLFSPFEEHLLPDYGCGITNIVNRATIQASELSAEELREGAALLQRKTSACRPRALAVLGIDAYRKAFETPRAAIGKQRGTIGAAAVWVLPNPSGINAHYQMEELVRLFSALRAAAFEL
jgi:TDG/mug DNA glycosylase family protein